MENTEVSHKEKKRKFFIEVEGYEARLKYKKRANDVLEVHKTEVPTQLRGKGIGNLLMESVLNYAREYNYKIKPSCSFASKYIERHPEYNEIIVRE